MLQALLIIFVYVLGPAFIFTWAVRRYRSGVKPDFPEVALIIIAVFLIGLLIWNYSGTVTDTDRDDANAIVSSLISSYQFPVKARYQDRPAVEGIPQAREIQIRIYGVEQMQEQEKIEVLARKLRKQIASKPVVLEFYKEEVWQENADGSRHPMRNQEQILRKFRIE